MFFLLGFRRLYRRGHRCHRLIVGTVGNEELSRTYGNLQEKL